MKVIDIDEIIARIDKKFDEVIYKTLNKNDFGWGDVCMFPNTRELFNLKIALINELNTLKIIEEPKENKITPDDIKNIGKAFGNMERLFRSGYEEGLEEPKKELEEIELLKMEVRLAVSEGQSYINHEIALIIEEFNNKINELIANQNKIIRKLNSNE